MDHYFECSGIAYRVILLTPLNETDRTTEPKFTVSCQAEPLADLTVTLVFVTLILTSPCLFEVFTRRCPFACEWIATVIWNILVLIYNLYNWRDPAKYEPLPKRQTTEEIEGGSALLPYWDPSADGSPPYSEGIDASDAATTTTTTETLPVHGQDFPSWRSTDFSLDGGLLIDSSSDSAAGEGGATDVTDTPPCYQHS
ncbi:MAG: hypothetical protein JOS17DRAFT_779498 [Linnemannia elongata]|nr:MAG: hypothetical protein JOS17DRAFT_779498 [Linnemannia elongata]